MPSRHNELLDRIIYSIKKSAIKHGYGIVKLKPGKGPADILITYKGNDGKIKSIAINCVKSCGEKMLQDKNLVWKLLDIDLGIIVAESLLSDIENYTFGIVKAVLLKDLTAYEINSWFNLPEAQL